MKFSGKERRQHPRVPVTARVTIESSGHDAYYFTKDLSLGGAGLISDDPIPIGTYIDIELSVTGVQRLIRAQGKVVRHFYTPEKGFGVFFTRFQPHSLRRLEKALEKMAKV